MGGDGYLTAGEISVVLAKSNGQWCGLKSSLLGLDWSENKKKSVLILVLHVFDVL